MTYSQLKFDNHFQVLITGLKSVTKSFGAMTDKDSKKKNKKKKKKQKKKKKKIKKTAGSVFKKKTKLASSREG